MSETKEKKVNYTPEQVAELKEAYKNKLPTQSNAEFCTEWGAKLGKPARSIVSKLSREGLYVAEPKSTKKAGKEDGPSKKELFIQLEKEGFDPTGLEGATKEAITRILNLVLATQVENEVSEDTDSLTVNETANIAYEEAA